MKTYLFILFMIFIAWWIFRKPRQVKSDQVRLINYSPEVAPKRKISSGGNLVVNSCMIAFVSLFFTWSEMRFLWFNFAPLTGFALKMAYTLSPWAYPIYMVIVRQRMSLSFIFVVSAIALILPELAAYKISQRGWGPFHAEVGVGVYVLRFASFLLIVGMWLDWRSYANKTPLKKRESLQLDMIETASRDELPPP